VNNSLRYFKKVKLLYPGFGTTKKFFLIAEWHQDCQRYRRVIHHLCSNCEMTCYWSAMLLQTAGMWTQWYTVWKMKTLEIWKKTRNVIT